MGKRTVSGFILVALVAGFIAILAPAASALTSAESCFYNSINAERAAKGKPKLSLQSDLVSLAREHSREMAAKGTIYHNNNLGNDIPGRWTAAGENVGMGPDCSSIHDAFMSSPGHRANILDTDYNQVGTGVAFDDEGTMYITEVFARRSSTTTTVTRRTTTRRTVSSTPAPRRTAPRNTVAAAAKPKPKPKPAFKPVLRAAPWSVSNLVKLAGMDARQVDPSTGAAMGI